MDNYKYAAQNKLRFPSVRGALVVEDLYDLPLTSRNGADLDTIAKTVNNALKGASEDSFVIPSTNPLKKPLEVSLEIVKDVIATKQELAAAAVAKTEKAAKRQKILDIIESKRDQELSSASIEDLTKQLQELEA